MACVTLKRPLEFDPLHTSPVQAGPGNCSHQPLKRRRLLMPHEGRFFHSSTYSSSPLPSCSSAFANASHCSSISETPAADAMGDGIREQIRLQYQNLFQKQQQSLSENSGMEVANSGTLASPTSSKNKGKPIISIRQLNRLCRRMLRQREGVLRQRYDEIFTQNMLQNYQKYVNFTSHRVSSQLAGEEASSYMS